MGLFFSDRPGRGIDKDAPKKQGVFLFFELLWRKLGKIFLSNMLYFAVSLPVLVIYNMILMFLLSMVVSDAEGILRLSVLLTVVLAIFWGTGPVSCGYAYLMRSFAREEHTWIWSDFFKRTKENFKYGIITFVIDIVTLIVGGFAVIFYWQMMETGGMPVKIALAVLTMTAAIYTIMHFYIFQFIVTFENTLRQVYKNSLLLSIATLPMCVVLAAIVFVLTDFVFGKLQVVAAILLAAIVWISLMRFIIDFYTARVIKKQLIDTRKESDEQDAS